MNIHITRKLVLALVAVSVIGTTAAVVTLFTHTFPTVTVAAAVLASSCPSTTMVMNPSSVISGTSGTIVAHCSGVFPNFSPIQVVSTGSATPTFPALPTGYTTLAIFRDDTGSATTCTGASTGYVGLASGTAVSFTAPVTGAASAFFDYCLGFSSAPAGGLGTFSITWSQ